MNWHGSNGAYAVNYAPDSWVKTVSTTSIDELYRLNLKNAAQQHLIRLMGIGGFPVDVVLVKIYSSYKGPAE
jgi:hypothetical protein